VKEADEAKQPESAALIVDIAPCRWWLRRRRSETTNADVAYTITAPANVPSFVIRLLLNGTTLLSGSPLI